jgi:hypothetical protein
LPSRGEKADKAEKVDAANFAGCSCPLVADLILDKAMGMGGVIVIGFQMRSLPKKSLFLQCAICALELQY